MTAGSILQRFGVDVLDVDDRVGHQTSTVNTPSTSGSPPPATALALLAPAYARGLNADHDAVRNGLPLPHSSGAVEGNVDRKCSTGKCTDARTSTSQIEAAGKPRPGSRGRPATRLNPAPALRRLGLAFERGGERRGHRAHAGHGVVSGGGSVVLAEGDQVVVRRLEVVRDRAEHQRRVVEIDRQDVVDGGCAGEFVDRRVGEPDRVAAGLLGVRLQARDDRRRSRWCRRPSRPARKLRRWSPRCSRSASGCPRPQRCRALRARPVRCRRRWPARSARPPAGSRVRRRVNSGRPPSRPNPCPAAARGSRCRPRSPA